MQNLEIFTQYNFFESTNQGILKPPRKSKTRQTYKTAGAFFSHHPQPTQPTSTTLQTKNYNQSDIAPNIHVKLLISSH